jgi:hypothetical protein
MKTCWSSESLKTIVWAYMPITIEWPEIALRLALTVVAGTLIGLNRSEHGHSAGLRTTLLVCLAASVSMIQVNLLLPIAGKSPDSFAVLDLMRLPLGILSGMGFIGAGAILRKGSLVRGLTTAATLWFVTVLGLCFGGGVILWSVDPLDWKRPGASVITQRILTGAQSGAIILSHDIHQQTVDAMAATLDALLAKGFKFVTVSELIAMNHPKPPSSPAAVSPTSKK